MKRIASLKVELTLFAFIALIISVSSFFYLQKNPIIQSNKSDQEKIAWVNSLYSHYFKKDIEKINLNDKNICEKFNAMSIEHGFNFYIVKKDGEVIASSNKDIKRLDENKIIDGKREILNLKVDKNMSLITGCNYLKDGYYVYFSSLSRSDNEFTTILMAIFTFVVIFSLLSLGRINYIVNIKKSIKIITQGKLSYRVQLKYRNELRELAEDINYMASELEIEDEKRKEFLTNISHDLRTPLTSILGYLNMIKEQKYKDDSEFKSYIEKVTSKSLFLKSMLDDFFQYSKLSSRDIEVNSNNIYIQELVRQLVEEEEPVFQHKNLKICSSLAEEPIQVKGDGELLVRAVSNLLSNALKYSKQGTEVNIKVYKERIRKDTFSVISVGNVPKDHVSKDDIQNFFKRQYKKDKSRNSEGSGLGLSIVKEILRLHNGYVEGSIKDDKLIFKMLIRTY